MGRVRIAVRALLGAAALLLATSAPASAARVSQDLRFTASDGVSLQTTLSGEGPIARRPVIVEFSPYGDNSQTADPGPDYNFLLNGSGYDVSRDLFGDELDASDRRFALAETLAHLERLVHERRAARRVDDYRVTYTAT